MTRTLAITVLLLVASACAVPTMLSPPDAAPVTDGGLTLTADAETYRRGDTARLVLRNASEATYEGGVLGCAGTERWDGDAWTVFPDDRACIAMLVGLEPGRTLEADLPLDVPPGVYRLTHTMSRRAVGVGAEVGTTVTVATAPFTVTR